jgi:hypothetical protein
MSERRRLEKVLPKSLLVILLRLLFVVARPTDAFLDVNEF